MISFPNCKINLGLHITGKRTDGFHNLESVFLPVQLTDALEVKTASTTSLTIHNLKVEGDITSNLIYKAWELLNDKYAIPPVEIHLIKNIPAGGGLGGGSADGSFMLNLLNEYFQLNLEFDVLEQYAAQLGSDCPFFIRNQPALVTGRGEFITPIELQLSAYKVVLINPGIHISTAEAFKHIIPTPIDFNLKTVIESKDFTQWRIAIKNDFETGVFKQYPQLADLKNTLYQNGALYASMTGTGSTVYGLFEKEQEITLSLDNSYKIWEVSL